MPIAEIRLNVATPDVVRSGGAEWAITAGFSESPFGRCLIAECPHGICYLGFGDADVWPELQTLWSDFKIIRDDPMAASLADRVFVKQQALDVFVKGSEFQLKVWRALLEIPCGEAISYRMLANRIGNPKAIRAAGAAVGKNPVAYIIPCHRIVHSDGSVGGYRWGVQLKSEMLMREQAIQGNKKGAHSGAF
ncbi:MAG TPA: methylated-DNA--[protein]-cysteine S-methyltransferase [Pontiella sp.]